MVKYALLTQDKWPVPVAAPSKAWVRGCSLAEIEGSNSTGGMDVVSLVSIVCCQVEVFCDGSIARPGDLCPVCVIECDVAKQ